MHAFAEMIVLLCAGKGGLRRVWLEVGWIVPRDGLTAGTPDESMEGERVTMIQRGL